MIETSAFLVAVVFAMVLVVCIMDLCIQMYFKGLHRGVEVVQHKLADANLYIDIVDYNGEGAGLREVRYQSKSNGRLGSLTGDE